MTGERLNAVLSLVGLKPACGHALVKGPGGDLMTLQNKLGTNYLLCSFSPPSASNAALLRESLAQLPTVSVAIQFDRKNKPTGLFRKNVRTGDVDAIASLDAPAFLPSSSLLKPDDLKPLNQRVENLLFELHSAFRDIDGLHAPEALDEICKLIYAKVFDEESSLKTHKCLFQRSAYQSTEECAAEVRKLFLQAVEEDKAVSANKIPTYDRSRGVFREQLLLSSPAIMRAVELLQHYDFTNSPIDIKGRAFQNVLLPAVRAGMGQYFTPKTVIELIVQVMRPCVRDLILDPFCGSGHFLTAASDHVRTTHGRSDKQFREFAFTRLHGIEKSDRMVRIAMTDMRLHGDGHSNVRCTDALLPFSNYPDLFRESFDVIMTNPPFGVDLPRETVSQLGPFTLAEGHRPTLSLEVLALERCMQLLRPGGRLAIILPDSMLSNKNSIFVRHWLAQHARLRAILSLPIETFMPFGATIKTSVLIARKLGAGERADSDHQIFLAEISNVGHDASGRAAPENDLSGIGQAFCAFIDREGW